jgi:CheY-like chemotaxis protein
VSKQLVELMGGEIGVESEVSRGSTFWFTVRLVKQRSDQAEARPLPPFRGVQVLVVDDNATQRLILDQCLTRWGMCPVLAEDGRQALGLAAAGSGPFQLAIVDFQMPGMNGLDLARHLSGGDTGRDLPVILLAAAGEVDPVLAGDAGIAVTVMKPVRQSDLHDAIVTVLAPTSGVPVREPALMTPPPAVHEDGGVPVLVAEDNALNQMVATGLLKALGYHPDVAGNGLEALEALERRDYALVLMDCQMPEMDGYQATAEIRRREAGGRRVPIIAMTANAMAGDREACLAAGMDDYISKPIERRALAELLDRWRKVTAVPEDDATVLDPAAHERMVENFGDDAPAVLDGLIGVFFQDAPELIATLRAATEAGTVADVRLPAHTLKSNAATLGATALAALCQQAESLSAAGSLEGLPRLVAEIESEYERVKGALQALQRSLARG